MLQDFNIFILIAQGILLF